MKIAIKIILIALALSTFTSCFVGDEALEGQNVFDLGALESSCELDTDRLEFILDENVSKEIACLETNLNQFAEFVKLNDPNFISRPELSKFIELFFQLLGEFSQLVYAPA